MCHKGFSHSQVRTDTYWHAPFRCPCAAAKGNESIVSGTLRFGSVYTESRQEDRWKRLRGFG
jgi:hypothetical protein